MQINTLVYLDIDDNGRIYVDTSLFSDNQVMAENKDYFVDRLNDEQKRILLRNISQKIIEIEKSL